MKKLVIAIISIVSVFAIFLILLFNFVLYPTKYKNYVTSFSEKYSLEIALVYAVIKTESNFKFKAKSPSGALGLMQIMPSTAKYLAKDLGINNFEESMLFNPKTNIEFGCYYLNYLFKKFKNKDVVICAYNAGEGAVKNWLDENGNLIYEKINYLETKNYYKKVMSYYNVYSNNEISV